MSLAVRHVRIIYLFVFYLFIYLILVYQRTKQNDSMCGFRFIYLFVYLFIFCNYLFNNFCGKHLCPNYLGKRVYDAHTSHSACKIRSKSVCRFVDVVVSCAYACACILVVPERCHPATAYMCVHIYVYRITFTLLSLSVAIATTQEQYIYT